MLVEMFGTISSLSSATASLLLFDYLVSVIGSSDAACTANAVLSFIDQYTIDEQSWSSGAPKEMYLFNRDATEYWSYNTSDIAIIYSGRTYDAVLIKRNDIQLSTNSLKNQIEITVALDNPFALNFVQEPLRGNVQLTIYRQHTSANSTKTYWKGYVRHVKFKPHEAIIYVGLKPDSTKRFGLMRRYQRNCSLVLYSQWCGISEADTDFYVTGTIDSVNGSTIVATAFGTEADGWFLGGKFKTDNGNCLQRIVYHSGTTIKIDRVVSALAAGNTFIARAGCDKSKAICKSKFSNKLNFGGQAYIPTKNPFVGSLLYD